MCLLNKQACMAMLVSEGHTNHSVAFPQTKAKETFQPDTATGKLKAVITPTSPSGFQFSNNTWPGPRTIITLF